MSIEIVGNACFRCDVVEFLIGAPKFQAALQIIETQHNSLHQNFGLFGDTIDSELLQGHMYHDLKSTVTNRQHER